MKVRIDKAGRIVLPKPMRDELGMKPGDALDIVRSGEGIILRPSRSEGQLRKKHGVWIYRVGEPLSAGAVTRTIRRVRHERETGQYGNRP
ncbi:MAG TPA: AbrB/MazE/SpoVT family DNA-binding domain-containing protein [Candidatus Saccharimonadales bacterium]|nr:AbrB/MazE/SpoVT family DNA-binding domain-containing protein [Candidatus Saccharimonadales bacterium]